ncbi:hypothetical protein CTA1_11617 [Colletotrichum tanaceti]|uniref:Uncharacterized protein n=1 Tax=Colletotrichum tanaceti TaxID=1306861 RepID=A0A4U6XSX9_9PEZI|nr:hypothetical protein CTA1_11617 [Colletotrichum tanaceti]
MPNCPSRPFLAAPVLCTYAITLHLRNCPALGTLGPVWSGPRREKRWRSSMSVVVNPKYLARLRVTWLKSHAPKICHGASPRATFGSS